VISSAISFSRTNLSRWIRSLNIIVADLSSFFKWWFYGDLFFLPKLRTCCLVQYPITISFLDSKLEFHTPYYNSTGYMDWMFAEKKETRRVTAPSSPVFLFFSGLFNDASSIEATERRQIVP
jgi:hypothetical protein